MTTSKSLLLNLFSIVALPVFIASSHSAYAQPSSVLQPSFGETFNGVSLSESDRFHRGATAFQRNFSTAEGLGPAFNAQTCSTCHGNPALGGGAITTGGHGGVTHFGNWSTTSFPPVFDPLLSRGGTLLQTGWFTSQCREQLPDIWEANFQLRRVATAMWGSGLVEAILDAAILHNEASPPSQYVSGRANLVVPLESPSVTRVGRFGWKSQEATILSFTARAARDEIGITNSLLPTENAPNGDVGLLAQCDSVPDPEDAPTGGASSYIQRTTDFQRYLAEPPQTPRSGMSGEVIFGQIGCADCHTPAFTTSSDPSIEPIFRNRVIRPYSDFLLHDMGDAGDRLPQSGAQATEMRTAPLWGRRESHWGQGLYWHDGGTSTLEGAILRHDAPGSEATHSVAAYNQLSVENKARLKAFLMSLGRREFDHDLNYVVDANDWGDFVACYNRSGVITPDDTCAVSDLNQDGDVNDIDAEGFAKAFTGPEFGDCDCNQTNDFIDLLHGAQPLATNTLRLASCGAQNTLSNSPQVRPGQFVSFGFSAVQGDYALLAVSISGRGGWTPVVNSCSDIAAPTVVSPRLVTTTGQNFISLTLPMEVPNIPVWAQVFLLRNGQVTKTSALQLVIR